MNQQLVARVRPHLLDFLQDLVTKLLEELERPVPRRSYHGSQAIGGEAVLWNLLNSDAPDRIWFQLRMSRSAFLLITEALRRHSSLDDTVHCSLAQQLAMWMKVWAHGWTIRSTAEYFQHSTETVSRHVDRVLKALCIMHDSYVKLPDPNIVPEEIEQNSKFFPYFKDCIGALDGTFIQGAANPERLQSYRGRKSGTGMNALVVCNFNLSFLYVLPGYGASAHDATVLRAARHQLGFEIPEGKYYLGDAGYGASEKVLTPYRRVRYHLKEQQLANAAPTNAKELFNLRHASLRNAVERVIGVLKRRFALLRKHNEFRVEKQVQGVYACTMLHNILLLLNEGDFAEAEPLDPEEQVSESAVSEDDSVAGSRLRDSIAQAMWYDYQRSRR